MNQKKLLVLEKCRKSSLYQGRILRPDDYYLPTPPFHNKVAPLLTNPLVKQGLIVAPRDTAKSSLSVESVRSHYLHINTDYDSVIIIQSKTRKEAIKRLWSIKSMIKYNRIYRDLYGKHSDTDYDEQGRKLAPIWQSDYIKFRYNDHWVTIASIGMEQQVRGILEDGTRVTYLLLDDPEDENNTRTQDEIDDNYGRLISAIATLDKRIGYVRVIGTPIVQGCMVDRIASNPTGWEVQWYAANKDMYGNPGLLWEEKYSQKDLDDLFKDLESKHMLRKYYSEYECVVKGTGEGFFKEEYLQYWDGKVEYLGEDAYLVITHRGDTLDNLIKLDVPEIRPVNSFLGVDLAASTSDDADFTVIMRVLVDVYRNIYVMPYYRKRVAPTVSADYFVDLVEKTHPKRAHVESNQYQTLWREIVKQRLADKNLYISGLETPYLAIGKKEERLEILHSFFADKKVYFHPDTYDFVRELIMFGTKRGHDDTLDAFYWATRKLILPDHTIENIQLEQNDRIAKVEEVDDEEIIARYREAYGIRGKKRNKSWLGIT